MISDKGVRPNPERVRSLSDFPAPTNVSDLRSFLGLANQLGHFVPDLSQATVTLRGLLKSDVAWNWLDLHQNEFEKVKKILTSELVLQPFDVEKKTFLLTDASKLFGIGWALMQESDDGKSYLVECGSQSLTDTQKRYAVIELEAMAIFQAVKKLRFYLQGCRFTVVTDHRPLVGIFKKPLNEIDNVRLLRYREALASFQMSVEWKAGRTHQIADALSRYPVFK